MNFFPILLLIATPTLIFIGIAACKDWGLNLVSASFTAREKLSNKELESFEMPINFLPTFIPPVIEKISNIRLIPITRIETSVNSFDLYARGDLALGSLADRF